MNDNQLESECDYCNNPRNSHNCQIGNLRIVRRRSCRKQPKEADDHIHICITISDIGVFVKKVPLMVMGALAILLVAVFVLARSDVAELTIGVPIIAVVTTVMASVIASLLADPRARYGELLLSLSQVRTVSDPDNQKQCLMDAALKLYTLDGCGRKGFLEWINDETNKSVLIELADKLTRLLCKDINWHIMRRIGTDLYDSGLTSTGHMEARFVNRQNICRIYVGKASCKRVATGSCEPILGGANEVEQMADRRRLHQDNPLILDYSSSMNLTEPLDRLTRFSVSFSQQESAFERMTRTYLQIDPLYCDRFEKVFS